MLIFGSSQSDWEDKAQYAEAEGENEFTKVREVRCAEIEDVQMAMAAMAAMASITKCKKFVYHATINLLPGERLATKQWFEAVDRLEQGLKLNGHHRIVFEHIKNDRQHYHIFWSRIAPEGGRAVNMANNYRTHINIAKELEERFQLKAAPRQRKENATDIERKAITAQVNGIYHSSKTAREFVTALGAAGYELARGKNDSLLLVDASGHYMGLLRRLDGVRKTDLAAKFPDLDKLQFRRLDEVKRISRPSNVKPRIVKVFRRSAVKCSTPARRITVGRQRRTPKPSSAPRATKRLINKLLAMLRGQMERTKKLAVLPIKPVSQKGWPAQAIRDWEDWGYWQPPLFFAKWPELNVSNNHSSPAL